MFLAVREKKWKTNVKICNERWVPKKGNLPFTCPFHIFSLFHKQLYRQAHWFTMVASTDDSEVAGSQL